MVGLIKTVQFFQNKLHLHKNTNLVIEPVYNY